MNLHPDKQRWRRIERIFHRALQVPDPQRPGVVERLSGGDEQLAREVLSLVEALRAAPGFLEDRSDLTPTLITQLIEFWELENKPVDSANSADSVANHADETPPQNMRAASIDADRDPQPASRHGGEFDAIKSTLQQLRPDYEIVAWAGEGGAAIVLRAVDRRLERDVAIKVLRSDWAARLGEDYLEREARAASLVSDHVVRIYEVAPRDSPLPFLVMEWIEGPSLQQYLAEHQVLPSREAGRLSQQIAVGLGAAHARGLIHGDVKPANILLERQPGQQDTQAAPAWRAKIADFGLARRAPGDASQPGSRSRAFFGTPAYASPQQLLERCPADAHSDVWGLGVTLYQMLVGTPPYTGAPHTIARRMQREDPVRLRKLDPRIPRDLESICFKALSREPEARYPTAAEMADDLRRYLAGKPVVARPITAPVRAWRATRRRPLVSALVALLAVALVGGAIASNHFRLRAERNLATAEDNLQLAEQHLQLAQQRLGTALDAIDDFFVTVSENRLLNEPGLKPLRSELLEIALPHLEQLAETAPGESVPRLEWVRVRYRLAQIKNSIEGPREALQVILPAVPAIEHLAAEEPENEAVFTQLVNTLMVVGIAYENQLAMDQAEETWRRIERLCLESDHAARFRLLALLYLNWGKHHATLGQFQQSIDVSAKGLSFADRALAIDPQREDVRRWQAVLKGNNGMTLLFLRRIDEAMPLVSAAVQYWQQQQDADPRDLEAQSEILRHEVTLAMTLVFARRAEEARAITSRHLPRAAQLVSQNPTWRDVRDWYAQLLLVEAMSIHLEADFQGALGAFDQAVDVIEQVLEEEPDEFRFLHHSIMARLYRGLLHSDLGQPLVALEEFAVAVAIFDSMQEHSPAGLEAFINSGRQILLLSRAGTYHQLGDRDAAAKDLGEASGLSPMHFPLDAVIAAYQGLLQHDPDDRLPNDFRVALQAAPAQWREVEPYFLPSASLLHQLAAIHAAAATRLSSDNSSGQHAESPLPAGGENELVDTAFRLLQRAAAKGYFTNPSTSSAVESDPWLVPLHADPRWPALFPPASSGRPPAVSSLPHSSQSGQRG